MTLLHQAAQKAVEALKRSRLYIEEASQRGYDGTNGHSIRQEARRRLKETDEAIATWESALQQQPEDDAGDLSWEHRERTIAAGNATLQQQPEPVAVWQSQCKDGTWTDCTEANARAGERYGFAMRALYTAPPALQHQEVPAAVRDAHGNIVLHNGREVCYRDEAPPTALHQEEPSTAVIPPAPPECETEDEKTAFSFGYWQGLHAARKGQEVPREPVAFHTGEALRRAGIVCGQCGCPDLMYEGVAASPSTTRQQEVRPVFDELIAFEETCEVKPTFADAVSIALAAKKRTRQQEAGSGPDWKEYALHYEKALRHIAETAFASKDWKYAREALAAAPSTPEKAGGVSDGLTPCEAPSTKGGA